MTNLIASSVNGTSHADTFRLAYCMGKCLWYVLTYSVSETYTCLGGLIGILTVIVDVLTAG